MTNIAADINFHKREFAKGESCAGCVKLSQPSLPKDLQMMQQYQDLLAESSKYGISGTIDKLIDSNKTKFTSQDQKTTIEIVKNPLGDSADRNDVALIVNSNNQTYTITYRDGAFYKTNTLEEFKSAQDKNSFNILNQEKSLTGAKETLLNLRMDLQKVLTSQNQAISSTTTPSTPQLDNKSNKQNNSGTGLSDQTVTKIKNLQGLQSFALVDLQSGDIISSHNPDVSPNSPASLIKLPLAAVLINESKAGRIKLNDKITLTQDIIADNENFFRAGQEVLLKDLVTQMEMKSNNTATNALIKHLGGVEKVNSLLIQSGYNNTKFANYLSLPGSTVSSNKSTASDISKALVDINSSNNDNLDIAKEVRVSLASAENPFHKKNHTSTLPNEVIGNKYGLTSVTTGGGYVIDVGSKKYGFVVFRNHQGLNGDATAAYNVENRTGTVNKALSYALEDLKQ
jgi:Beta-lactamase enzyme family